MEERRKKRYAEKIELIKKRIEDVGRWKSAFFIEEKDRLATYKAFQEIGEACMDLVAMMLGDEGKIPEDDYININKLEGLGIVTKNVKDGLADLNGLRNRIVHEYNGLDDRIALDSIEELTPLIAEFVSAVEKWIKNK